MKITLGGPGVACSALRVRRLEAGELAGDEAARTAAHVAGCGRCQEVQGELARERAELARSLPFEAFAAGVADRLAAGEPAPRRRAYRGPVIALAAGLLLAGAVPVIRGALAERDDGYRLKGGAELAVYVREGGGARALLPAEPVPAGAPLRVGLVSPGRRHVAVALVDGEGAALLYAGTADPGALPGAFEWTGAGPGALVAVLDDAPVDADALLRRLAAGGVAAASPGGRAEVVVRPLRGGEGG